MRLHSLKLNSRAYLAIIALAGIILCLPMILYGFPAYSHDGWTHALWSANFSNQFWSGDLYPRWLVGLNHGLGSPAFFFYPPLPYYLTSIFKPFFSQDADGWWRLGFAALIAVIAAGWFAYLWLRRFVDRSIACSAAVFYTALPYHLIVDLYIRGAFAEVFAFVWMPLILYFASRLKERSPLVIAGLAISYALLIFSHLPTAMIFAPVPVGYACFTAEARKIRAAFEAAASMVLGAGLAAIYLLPAIGLREFVSMQEMQHGHTNFENWFLFSGFALRELGTQLSLITAASLILACCCFAMTLFGRKRKLWPEIQFWPESQFWIAVALLTVFVITPLSKPVWKLLPILQNIQFPFRFHTILAVANTMLFALAIKSTVDRKLLGRIAMATALVFFIVTAGYGWRQYKIHGQLSAAKNDLVANNMDAPEYRPRWTGKESLASTALQPGQIRVVEGSAETEIESWQPRKITLLVKADSPATADVRQLFFPGWQWRLDDSLIFQDAQPSPSSGLVRLALPAGKHRIELHLNATPAERIGRWISAICLGLLVMFCLVRRRY